MQEKSPLWLATSLAILSGWNIAILAWFFIAIGIAALMSHFKVSLGDHWFTAVLVYIVVALIIGVIAGKFLFARFRSLTRTWSVAWLVVLLLVTVALFPGQFTYVLR